MKKKNLIGIAVILLASAVAACHNQPVARNPEKAEADSLETLIEEGHNAGMVGTFRMRSMRKEAHRLLDSIAGLPVKAKNAAMPMKEKLEDLLQNFDRADSVMNGWMAKWVPDTLTGNLPGRIKYLVAQKMTMEDMKRVIESSLKKADSLLKPGL